ncbi:MAG: ribonuclease P protein component [Patescibacteria group bacterium]|nr:ribonuclease P protein component [Patescibacteria group bacterium]MDD5554277.1 ribonuclease P protein component [Patescibacteria group bacterium]
MMKKENQLKKDKEFDWVFKNGRSGFGKFLGIKAAANGLGASRFGILVSNKISKNAVERNKIKRQIREMVRLQIPIIKPGFDVVIITLPLILGKSYLEVEKEIGRNFKKLGLYR